MMDSQVQLLEDLLERVQRNRLRMNSQRTPATTEISDSGYDAYSTSDDDDAAQAVIDLVNPTSVAPAAVSPDFRHDVNSEQSFAGVAPVSIMPESTSAEAVAEDEDDFSAVAPISIAPPSNEMVDDSEQAGVELPEDDFSTVAPVSIVPPSANAAADDDFADELPPSMVPSTPITVPSESASVDLAPLSEPMEPAADTPPDGEEGEAEELELVNTDVAAEDSRYPGSIVEAISSDAHKEIDEVEKLSKPEPAPIEHKSFEVSAIATDKVVELSGALSTPKVWTIAAVLKRALEVGRS